MRSAALLLVAGLGLGLAGCGGRSAPALTATQPPSEDPRLTFATPYKNVKPNVQYVGDDACAQCHPAESESFHHHPMGRSLAPVAARAGRERYDAAARNPFTAEGFEFQVERRGDKVFHQESRRDAQGRVISQMNVEIHYVVGSGEHGHSYLIEHDGYLFQSPLSWYTQKQAWDLSPGFTAETHADRKVLPGCMYCHCNAAEPVPNTVNRYRQPVFRGYSIGCERCHGPGELHVARRQAGEVVDGLDDTIVNPRRLPAALRESVCQQCHITGEVRVLRRGRETFDYRPGLPLNLFWSVYIRRPGLGAENKSVSHVQQMYESRCFKGSRGGLGCISCHDPHSLPPPEMKAAYYRSQCLKCHDKQGCNFPSAARQEKDNDCTVCHMTRFPSTDIAHTAFTDHRVLRRPQVASATGKPSVLAPGESPIVPFLAGTAELSAGEAERDLGVALVELCRRDTAVQKRLAPLALPMLESALQVWREDVVAAEGRASALWMSGQANEGLTALQELLERSPERESALADAAYFSATLGRRDEAIVYWKRALKVNPWAANYHHETAALLAERQRWQEALQECRTVLQLNPASPETRLVLVNCLLRTGKNEEAQIEFEKLLALEPKDSDRLRRWYSEQVH